VRQVRTSSWNKYYSINFLQWDATIGRPGNCRMPAGAPKKLIKTYCVTACTATQTKTRAPFGPARKCPCQHSTMPCAIPNSHNGGQRGKFSMAILFFRNSQSEHSTLGCCTNFAAGELEHSPHPSGIPSSCATKGKIWDTEKRRNLFCTI